ncbi:MAG: asparagine synthase (glutamine-hydrolyzing) [Actinopolymorphaceae bacterium]
MCGVVGILRFDGAPVDPSTLGAMTATLHHRGPDAIRTWVEGPVGLGHTRLSIIDVGGSAQPLWSADGSQVIVFNGEAFNYREVRAAYNYPYRTNGDTEVVLAAHQRAGERGVAKVRGQFAFGVWDTRARELHLYRDRLGVLPLHYIHTSSFFAFASELKALLPLLDGIQVDEQGLVSYLAQRAVPAPRTLVKGVFKVMPGQHMTVSANGRVTASQYWSVPLPAPETLSDATAVALTREAIEASIAESLVADVPVGSLLSGGLDSSMIAMLASQAIGGGLRTYSAGFGQSSDETPHAEFVARLIRSDHTSVIVRPEEFSGLIPKLTWHRDAPLSEPADVAVYQLAHIARQDVKVLLSGEGSDELFGGYPKYRLARWFDLALRTPTGVRSTVATAARRWLPARARRAAILARALEADGKAAGLAEWFSPFSRTERHALTGSAAAQLPQSPPRPAAPPLEQMLYLDQHSWLSDNLLERGDRMCMAASLELRPPFLDHRVVEVAARLPARAKVRGRTGKWVVKQVAADLLPAQIVNRPKAGFKVPLDTWFRGDFGQEAHDRLMAGNSFAREAFDARFVALLLDEHRTGRRNHDIRLWTLLGLEIWHDVVTSPTPARR